MIRACGWLAVIGLLSAGAAAQNPARHDRPERPAPEIPTAGFWPTELMMNHAIDRIAEQMAKEYGFDEAQLWNTRELLKDRFPRWLQDNRAEIQTLFNQYVEAVMAGEPPTPEYVAEWAQRVKPLFGEFTVMVEDTVEDMGTYLTDEQRILVEGQMAAFRVGAGYMNQRLETWSQGGYDRRTDWPRDPGFDQEERRRREQLEREAEAARNEVLGIPADGGTESVAATSPPTDATLSAGGEQEPKREAKRKDEWAVYVEDFIRRYQLDEAQQNSAHKYLQDQTSLRDRYLRSRLSRINAVEGKLKAAKTEPEREKVQAELKQLHGPIDQMFEKLKERLDRLPTRKQRAAAAEAEQATKTTGAGPDKAALREQMQQRANAAKGPPLESSSRSAGNGKEGGGSR